MKRQQDKLLIIIAMSGEMPTYLGQYVTGSISYTAALITRLKKERYISLRCKDGYRGYVLLEKGRNYLLSEYEKELSFFISGSGQTGHVKSEPEKRMRLYRMSEVWVFFWKAGIEILRNHKPDMDKGFVRDRGKAFYYGSLEFKGMSEAIRGSRSCGVLLSGDTVLVVYNTMDRNMKWAKKMECSMRTWTERIEIVKAQFAKLTKDHVEFVLQSMDDTSTKARNIRAVLLTALYNSVNTINSYYGNRYHFHLAEETRREMEETD